MALSILDGNQSATTLSTILSSGQHITAHTVVSLGTQAITDMRSAVSGSVVSIPSLPAISGTVTANLADVTDPYNLSGYATKSVAVKLLNKGGVNIDSGTPLEVEIFSDGEAIGPSVPLPISGTVTANTFAVQGTAVTTSNFTSTTASTVLANFNATREVLTIFNEGAGNLHICAGATCTTIAYQVRLSAGDYYEVPNHQTSLTHSAVFATAGTARIVQIS
jgi:hypothetical protein